MNINRKCEFDIDKNLINSISITNSVIYFTSAYDNTVYSLDPQSSKIKKEIGEGIGYGKYRYREPVFCLSRIDDRNKLELVVCDWHNHRVIKYLDSEYHSESGIFHNETRGTIKSILSFIKNLSYKGRYISSHNTNVIDEPIGKINTLNSLCYAMKRLFNRKSHVKVNKPNGIIFHEGKYYFTQKNRSCVTVLDKNFNYLKNIILPKSGRVGNITKNHGDIYISVENPAAIYRMEDDLLEEVTINLTSDIVNDFAPFSTISIDNEHIAIISASKLIIAEKNSGEIVNVVEVGGELHGLEQDRNTLEVFVSDRLSSKIVSFEVRI